MNFAELCGRTEALCKLEGWTDVGVAPDWPSITNRGLYLFSWEAEYRAATATFTTVAGTSDYTLGGNGDWKLITDCVYGQEALLLTDEPQLRRENPEWLVAGNDVPTRFLMVDPDTIRLYPTPSASSVTVTVRGIQTEGPFSLDNSVPDCPDPYHEGIALLGAWWWGKQYARGEARERIASYRQEALQLAADLRGVQGQQISWRFKRRRRRETPERLPIGWYRSRNF